MPRGVTERYRGPGDLPQVLPLFPLRGAILLPRATLALNVFEPRYLLLVDYALAGDRLIGIVQPAPDAGEVRIAGRQDLSLAAHRLRRAHHLLQRRRRRQADAVAHRHRALPLLQDVESDEPFRFGRVSFAEFATDFTSGHGEEDVDRPRLLTTLRNYLIANNLSADWDRIDSASNERLVNTLSILSPYGAEEKQALLEARDLKARAEALVALAEMELASRDDGSGTSIQ